VAFSPQTMRDLARTKPIMPDPSRPVIFIAPTPDLFGMGRMFELQEADTRPNLRVVRTARMKPTRSSTRFILIKKHPDRSC
jgi:hypothetical protein